MKDYVILTTLTDEGRKTVKEYPERIKQVNKAVERWGAKILCQYALLGPYDFLTIAQAKDNKAILKIALEIGSRGTVQTVTIPAIPIDEFVEAVKEKLQTV